MKTKPWTERCVYFTPRPRTPEGDWEALFDDLPEVLWGRWWSRWFEPFISSCNRVICVGSWPWWIPRPVARAIVAQLAHKHNVGGDAVYVTERSVLARRNEDQ